MSAADRADQRRLAQLPARRRARPTLRLPRPRALGPSQGFPLQSGEDPARSVRARDRPRARLASVALRVCRRLRWRRRGGPDRQRAVRPARRRRRHHPGPARRAAPPGALGRDGDLRTARQGRHGAAPARAAGAARDVPRPGVRTRDRPPATLGRDGGRVDAGPLPHGRSLARRARRDELLGLQHARLLRARSPFHGVPRSARRAPGIQDDGGRPARGGARSDPRRRLQPHRRRRAPRPQRVVPRHRQHGLLPPDARPAVPLPGLHRMRQHAEHAVAAGAAAHHGQPPLLGGGDARGRLPVRPRGRARARAARGRSPVVVLRCGAAGPRHLAREAHRRAVGRGRRRVSGRQFPARMGRMERQVPRRRAALLAGRRGHAARARHAAGRQQRPVRVVGDGSRTPASTS